MSVAGETLPKSLCAIDLFRGALRGDTLARDTLMTSWKAGNRDTSESGIYCLTPCILANCDVTLMLDFGAEPLHLGSDDLNANALSGYCQRNKRSLDELSLNARATAWPAYTEHDIRPSDPDYMEI